MNCEEFEIVGLDAERGASANEAERAAAREHANTCSHCAALLDSWLAVKSELQALGEYTRSAGAPSRVEMRLLQEFRTRHSSIPAKRAAFVSAWVLAAAAVLVAAVSWRNWEQTRREDIAKHEGTLQSVTPVNSSPESLSAGDSASDFTLLPGIVPADPDDAAIVRVRMQRGALSALGLPVNEERAGEWIQVDLLVGADGLPQAVKLAD